jgi:hypothetical protein
MNEGRRKRSQSFEGGIGGMKRMIRKVNNNINAFYVPS